MMRSLCPGSTSAKTFAAAALLANASSPMFWSASPVSNDRSRDETLRATCSAISAAATGDHLSDTPSAQ